jgi:phosphoribosylformimino-5-aminoimidazole carboxamide ribotide isomerase
MSASFTVYPAIDVRGGRVVRLRQGDYAQETRYDDHAVAFARAYAQAGAQWLHLVDLDAARTGGYGLASLLRRIGSRTNLRVQTGGGVRSADDVQAILDAGAERVVVGSLAVREPATVAAWIARFGAERVAVALDTRQDADGWWRLPVHGWTEVAPASGAADLTSMLVFYGNAGLRHLLCTDIDRDGTLTGPNCGLYARIHAIAPMLAVQASGGVRDAVDVRAVRDAGCAGVVLGRCLLDGRLDVAEALSC